MGGRLLDTDALDSLLIRQFHRIQEGVRIDFHAHFARIAGDQ